METGFEATAPRVRRPPWRWRATVKVCRAWWLAILVVAPPALGQVARFDPASGELSIPGVSVGDALYVDVALRHTGSLVFSLQSAVAATPSGARGFAAFDPAGGTMSIPDVLVGHVRYRDVVLRYLGDIRFVVQSAVPSQLPAQVSVPPRWLDLWIDSGRRPAGQPIELDLSLLPPDGALTATPLKVDTVTGNSVLRIWGGHYDPLTLTLTQPGTRQLLYNNGSSWFRLVLDHDTSTPAPIPLAPECLSPYIVAQSATGDDAVLGCGKDPTGKDAFLRIGKAGPGVLFRAPAAAPGEAVLPDAFLLHERAGDTGAIKHLFWWRLRGGVSELLKTDPQGGAATVAATFNSGVGIITRVAANTVSRGMFLATRDTLYRYDFGSGQVRAVFAGLQDVVLSLWDDSSVMAWVNTTTGMRLIRCLDDPAASCTTLLDQAQYLTGPAAQTSKHLIFSSPGNLALVVRKADGMRWTIPLPPDSLSATLALAATGQTGRGVASGERILYHRYVLGQGGRVDEYVGTMAIDGQDRKEYPGQAVTSATGWPDTVSANLAPTSTNGHLAGLPYARVIVGQSPSATVSAYGPTHFRWLSLVSGELGPSLGSEDLSARNFGTTTFPHSVRMGPYGVIGRRGVLFQGASGAQMLDPLRVWVLGTESGSLRKIGSATPR